MTPVEIAQAAADGYSIVCATCRRLHEGRKQGAETCTGKDCGGPLSGRDFPEYVGPITDFTRWCFVCGCPAKYGAIAPGQSDRVFGMCKEHVDMVRDVRPMGVDGKKVLEVVHAPQGLVTVDQLLGKPKKTLLQAIVEAEAHYAGKT